MIKELNTLASEMIGDSQSPNLFFVTTKVEGTTLVTSDFAIAYRYWTMQPLVSEACLEDRKTGVICSNELDESGQMKKYKNIPKTYADSLTLKEITS